MELRARGGRVKYFRSIQAIAVSVIRTEVAGFPTRRPLLVIAETLETYAAQSKGLPEGQLRRLLQPENQKDG